MSDALLTVAVYGTLKRGGRLERHLHEARFLGAGCVSGFEMYNLISFPMVIHGEGLIHVELYEVTPEILANLDRVEGFPHFYGRQVVHVETGHEATRAWLYVGYPHHVEGYDKVPFGFWPVSQPSALKR